MRHTLTVKGNIPLPRRGRKGLAETPNDPGSTPHAPRVPRVSRLMALAIRFENLIRAGGIADYAEIARLGHVSRARITQIMNLLLLAPAIQEQILFLPLTRQCRDPIRLLQLQAVAIEPDWWRQRRRWAALLRSQS